MTSQPYAAPAAEPARPARRRRWPLLAALSMCLVLALGAGAVLYPLYRLPLPSGFAEPPRATTRMATASGAFFASRGTLHGDAVDIEELPPHLVAAVLAMEDRRFYDHAGIDARGILRAALANLRSGRVAQGGSTITQQLVKNTLLTPEQSFLRKAQEAMLALWLERRLGKNEILRRYLGSIYLGGGAYGVDAAARRYFDKPPQELTLAESAMLAGLIQAPSRHAPTRSLEQARQRAGIVLDRMVEVGAVSPAQAEAARSAPAQLAAPQANLPGAGYFADWADGEARRMLGDVVGEFDIATTLDATLQGHAERVVAAWLSGEAGAKGVSEAALVAIAPDGAVLAMVGGRDYGASQFNRAVHARRQPGSLFKLFVYLAALTEGFTPDSPILDAPIRIGDWEPRNYGDRYLGETDLRTAFARSLNAAAVRLAEQVGRERVVALAQSLGIESPLAPLPSLALGTGEVSLLELTAAYAAVAANASRVEPYGVRTIRGPGEILYTRPPAVRMVPSWPQAAALDLLSAVVRDGTGSAAALGRPVHGKTGTTQEHRDAWFVGFVDGLIVGVWVGNDDNAPMDGVTGGSLPARIWADFVAGAPIPPAPTEALPHTAPPPEPQQGPMSPPFPTVPPAAFPAVVLPAPVPAPEPAPPPPPHLIGVPVVRDTATLDVAGRTVRLEGVRGERGGFARDMAAYIGGREVVCLPTRGNRHRCEVDGWDLSEVVLFNGGGRATNDAPPDLRAAEAQARAGRKGVWGGR